MPHLFRSQKAKHKISGWHRGYIRPCKDVASLGPLRSIRIWCYHLAT